MHLRLRGKKECDFESRSQGEDPASYPKWAPQKQFRKPQISIPKSTNHFVISAQESRSQGEELVPLPSRIHQDPSPAQTGTDQLRTEYWSSSVNLFLVPFLIFFLIWLPVFPSTISESYYHMFFPQTWHHLELRSPGLLHTSLIEPPLGDAVFAPLANFSLGPKVTKSKPFYFLAAMLWEKIPSENCHPDHHESCTWFCYFMVDLLRQI